MQHNNQEERFLQLAEGLNPQQTAVFRVIYFGGEVSDEEFFEAFGVEQHPQIIQPVEPIPVILPLFNGPPILQQPIEPQQNRVNHIGEDGMWHATEEELRDINEMLRQDRLRRQAEERAWDLIDLFEFPYYNIRK